MITKEHIELMADILDGADIYGLRDARMIREIKKHNPGWVEILSIEDMEKKLSREFDGTKRLPYFGAILTPEGERAMDTLAIMYRLPGTVIQ